MTMTKRRHMTPNDWHDEDLQSMPTLHRLTWFGLRMFADDEGRESANAARIAAALFPLDRSVTEDTIDTLLLEFEALGLLVLYVVQGRTYFALRHWPRVDRPQDSRIPPPPPVSTGSGSSRDPISVEGEREERGESGVRSAEGEDRSRSDPDQEPSPFCSKHPEGTEQPCGGCGTARKRHEMWSRGKRATLRTPQFEDDEDVA